MITFHRTLISIVMCWHSILVTACSPRRTNRPLHDLRCVSTAAADMRQEALPQCVWRCLQMKDCLYINNNSVIGECELGHGQCESLQPAAGVLASLFGPLFDNCIRWGSSHKPGWVTVRVAIRDVARIVRADSVLIGNFYFRRGQVWANKKGVSIGPINEADQDIELLWKIRQWGVRRRGGRRTVFKKLGGFGGFIPTISKRRAP